MQDAAHKVEDTINQGIFLWKYKWFIITAILLVLLLSAATYYSAAGKIFLIILIIIKKLFINPILFIIRRIGNQNRSDQRP